MPLARLLPPSTNPLLSLPPLGMTIDIRRRKERILQAELPIQNPLVIRIPFLARKENPLTLLIDLGLLRV